MPNFILVYLWRANSGGKKNIFFSLSFFFLSFSSFSLGFTVAWPVLPLPKCTEKEPSVGSLCWYISKRPCKVTLIVLTVCTYSLLHTAARLSCLFFFFLQVIILHYTQIFVYSQLRGSQPRSLPAIRALKAEMFWSHFSVGNTFHTYQAISCVQMGPTHTTLLKLAPLQVPSTVAWVGCRRFECITFSVTFADVRAVDCTS